MISLIRTILRPVYKITRRVWLNFYFIFLSNKKSYAAVKTDRVASQKNTSVDVVVCVHNALEEVKRCLDSIARHRGNEKQKLIIVDDGSDKETAALLKSFVNQKKWASLVRHEKALGYTRAASAGMKASSAELVILLNSDTIVTDGWAEKMADALAQTPSAGIVGPLSNAASVQSIPDFRSSSDQTAINDLPKGYSIDDMNDFCEEHSPANILPRVPLVHGFCFGIKREVIEKIGVFDEKKFPDGYGEENDYCFRAANAGFGLVVATHTYVFHSKSKSFNNTRRVRLMEQGSKTLRQIYGERRVDDAVKSMVKNPLLIRMREAAQKLY